MKINFVSQNMEWGSMYFFENSRIYENMIIILVCIFPYSHTHGNTTSFVAHAEAYIHIYMHIYSCIFSVMIFLDDCMCDRMRKRWRQWIRMRDNYNNNIADRMNRAKQHNENITTMEFQLTDTFPIYWHTSYIIY